MLWLLLIIGNALYLGFAKFPNNLKKVSFFGNRNWKCLTNLVSKKTIILIGNKTSSLYMLFCHQTFFLKITLISLFLMIYLVYLLICFFISFNKNRTKALFPNFFSFGWLIIKYVVFSVLMSACFSVSDSTFLFSTFLLLQFYSLCVVNLIIILIW